MYGFIVHQIQKHKLRKLHQFFFTKKMFGNWSFYLLYIFYIRSPSERPAPLHIKIKIPLIYNQLKNY